MSEKEIQKTEVLQKESVKTESEAGNKKQNNQKRNDRKQKRKASFTSRKFKGGAYATVLSIIVIVLVLFINLAAGQWNLTMDLTTEARFSLKAETKEFLKGITDDITIYYLGITDSQEELFQKIVQQYPKTNANIQLEFVDIIKNPRFASQYTEETIDYDSFLVVNHTNGRSKYIPYSDMLVQEFNYSTYQMGITGIDVEGKLDAAIQYVTTEQLPTVYAVEGHGETGISETMGKLLSDSNISYQTLNTLTSEAVPQDCDVLLIYQPQSDYSEEEITLIKNYLTNGGNAVICIDYMASELVNFTELLNYYGVQTAEGIVLEGNTNYYIGNLPNSLVPTIDSSTLTEGIRGKKFIVSQVSSGLLLKEEIRDTLSVSGVLTTSDDAYSKVNMNSSTMQKEEGDIDGPFYVGVMAEEEYNGIETKVVIYSGKYLFEDSLISTSNYGNRQLFVQTINELAGEVETISVPASSLIEEMLVMTSAQKNQNGILLAAVLPVLILGIGIMVVVKRRR